MSLDWSHALEGVDWNELSALYRAAPLGDKAPADLQQAFTNSLYRCFVREDGRLVSVGRALADGVDCSCLCDIAVLPAHRGSGLGKRIVETLVERSRGHRRIILYAVPGREPFHARFGFRRMKTAMAIFANQDRTREHGYIDDD